MVLVKQPAATTLDLNVRCAEIGSIAECSFSAKSGRLSKLHSMVALAMWWLAHGEHEVPPGSEWLSAREQSALAAIRYTKRYVEFRTRRWTAKRAVAKVLERELTLEALAAIEIHHQVAASACLLPCVQVCGKPGGQIDSLKRGSQRLTVGSGQEKK